MAEADVPPGTSFGMLTAAGFNELSSYKKPNQGYSPAFPASFR
jgi:hypothetical protein